MRSRPKNAKVRTFQQDTKVCTIPAPGRQTLSYRQVVVSYNLSLRVAIVEKPCSEMPLPSLGKAG